MVNRAPTIARRRAATVATVGTEADRRRCLPGRKAILEIVHFVADRAAADGAAELIATFGADAGGEAARRAEASRLRGNAILFTRWRRIERMIAQLDPAVSPATLH